MKKRRKIKKKVIVLLVLIIVFIASIIGFIIYKNSFGNQEKVVGSIPKYGYELESNQPKIYKDLFKKLATELKKEKINYDNYATLISQMFAVDFYNLNNKESKNDIGGTEFVYDPVIKNFSLQASETVYKYIDNNFDNNRTQQLPEVINSEIISLTKETYKYKDITDNKVYKAKVKISYKKDLEYPTSLTIKLLHNNKKLEVYYME